jgi:heterotetrameric sarcosine oxidase gamma subunit
VAESANFTLEEMTGWSLFQIAAWPQSMAKIEQSLKLACGFPPPLLTGHTADGGGLTLIRIAPDRLWAANESGGDRIEFADTVDAVSGAVCRLTEGRRRFRLGGVRVRDVLAKSVAIDWESPGSAPGRAVQTMLHRVPVLLHRLSRDSFDLYAPRTLAQSVSESIADAALEWRKVDAEMVRRSA